MIERIAKMFDRILSTPKPNGPIASVPSLPQPLPDVMGAINSTLAENARMLKEAFAEADRTRAEIERLEAKVAELVARDNLAASLAVVSDDYTYSPDQVFPAVMIGRGVSVQLVWLTPELAAEWKKSIDFQKQRKINKSHLESLKRDHLEGRFILNGQPIIRSRAGVYLDGNHRITIVAETGKPMLVLVVDGISPDAFRTIDSGARRTKAQALASIGMPDPTAVGSVAEEIWNYENGTIFSPIKVSNALTEQIALDHPDIVHSVRVARTVYRKFGRVTAPGLAHFVFSRKDRDGADQFFARLADGLELKQKCPIYCLRRRLEREKPTRSEGIRMLFCTWNAWKDNLSVRSVQTCSENELPEPK